MSKKGKKRRVPAHIEVPEDLIVPGAPPSLESLADAPRYIDVKQACSITRLSEPTVRRRLTRRTWRTYKCGGKTLLSLAEVLASIRAIV
jgi:hypothetical protein